MINEVQNASEFLSDLLRSRGVNVDVIESFRDNLINVLVDYYNNHWFPEKPFKGSGYRCIRIVNKKMDPLISKAGSLCGLTVSQLMSSLPNELTMWIDPYDVSYRIGEEGSIGQLLGGPESDSSSNSGSDSESSSQEGVLESSSSYTYPGMQYHNVLYTGTVCC